EAEDASAPLARDVDVARCRGAVDVLAGAGRAEAGTAEHSQRLAQAFPPEVEHVIVREHAAVDPGDGQAIDVCRMHPIVNALTGPELIAGRDARLEIDDPNVRPLALELGERFSPDVLGSDASRYGAGRLLRELDIPAGVADEGLEQPRIARLSKHLIDA